MNSDPPSRIVVATVGLWRVGFRLEAVERVVCAVEITPLPEALPYVLGVIDVHGSIVPVLDFRHRLGCPRREVTISDHFILAQSGGRACAFVVDDVRGVAEVSADSLTPSQEIAPELERLDGIAQLADGLVLIEDLDRFLNRAEEQALSTTLDA